MKSDAASRMESLQRRLFGVATGLFAAVGLSLVASLLVGAWRVIGEPRSLANVLGNFWDPLKGQFGLIPFVVSTLAVTAIALVLAVVLGLGIGVTLSRQLKESWSRRLIQVLTVLTAVPSVIFGWWGLQTVVPWVRDFLGGPGFSLLAAGIVLSVMILPTMSLFFTNAMRSVPKSFQEGSAALGATADQTLLRLVIPCAFPGLVQGLLVAVARAVGETMAVQMVIGGQTLMPSGINGPGATLTTQLLTDLTVFPPGTEGHAVLDVMALMLLGGMYLFVRASERWGRPR